MPGLQCGGDGRGGGESFKHLKQDHYHAETFLPGAVVCAASGFYWGYLRCAAAAAAAVTAAAATATAATAAAAAAAASVSMCSGQQAACLLFL